MADVGKMPHLLIAGATGSGKSVCINTLIMSILYKADPRDVKLIMIDPKVVELSVYNGIPHLFCPVVTDPKEAAAALNWAVREMGDRYNKFKELGVRNIAGYNEKIKKMEDAQAANDLSNLANRFEKKLHDLDLTRTVSLQMGPQIRLIQNNDTMMVEKIQTAILNTIPLWKSQMVLALGLAHSEQAMKAQQAVSDTTNELLKKNAKLLKDTTVGIAEESERGIVDVETLKHTNQMLIDTLDEVVRIQNEGRQKRKAAEVELLNIENQLKEKMLEFRG